jgi:hypothetical protein
MRARRRRLYQVAFLGGLDDRYIEVIEGLFYERRDVLLEGDITGDLEYMLNESTKFREDYFQKQPLEHFQLEAAKLCDQMEELERRLFAGLAPQIEVKEL